MPYPIVFNLQIYSIIPTLQIAQSSFTGQGENHVFDNSSSEHRISSTKPGLFVDEISMANNLSMIQGLFVDGKSTKVCLSDYSWHRTTRFTSKTMWNCFDGVLWTENVLILYVAWAKLGGYVRVRFKSRLMRAPVTAVPSTERLFFVDGRHITEAFNRNSPGRTIKVKRDWREKSNIGTCRPLPFYSPVKGSLTSGTTVRLWQTQRPDQSVSSSAESCIHTNKPLI